MKRVVITLILTIVCCFLFSACKFDFDSSKIKVGMTHDEVNSLVPDEHNKFSYMNYSFFSDSDDNWIVVQYDSENKNVTQVETFKKREVTDADFQKIKEGMTPFEVVENIGLPYGSFTSGMLTLAFKTDDGNEYWVYFIPEGTVSSVTKLPKN